MIILRVSRDLRNQLEGDINAQLREACQEGEEYEVKRLLKEGADSYACDEVRKCGRMIHVTTIHRMGLMLFTMQHLQATSSVVG